MTPAAKSVFFFGIYMVIEGFILMLIPNVLLGILGITETQEIWINIVGFALIVLGYYYMQLGKNNVIAFFKWSYPVRIFQIVFFIGLVVLKSAPVILIGVAAVETASGIWTWLALRQE